MCKALWPDEVPCGHGDCVNGTCVCHAGWASVADFSTAGESCDVHLEAVKAMYLVVGMVSMVGLLAASSVLMKFLWKGRRNYRKFWRQIILFSCLTSHELTLVVASALKSSDPAKFTVCHSPLYTLLFSIWTSSFWTASGMITSVLVQFLSLDTSFSDAKAVGATLVKAERSLPATFIMIFVACWAPLASVFVDQADPATFAKIHYLGLLAVFLSMRFALFEPVCRKFISKVENATIGSDYSKDAKIIRRQKSTAKITHKLKLIHALRKEVSKQTVGNVIACCAFSFWPYMTRKATYQLALVWSASQALTFFCCVMFSPHSEGLYKTSNPASKQASQAIGKPLASTSPSSSPLFGRINTRLNSFWREIPKQHATFSVVPDTRSKIEIQPKLSQHD